MFSSHSKRTSMYMSSWNYGPQLGKLILREEVACNWITHLTQRIRQSPANIEPINQTDTPKYWTEMRSYIWWDDNCTEGSRKRCQTHSIPIISIFPLIAATVLSPLQMKALTMYVSADFLLFPGSSVKATKQCTHETRLIWGRWYNGSNK